MTVSSNYHGHDLYELILYVLPLQKHSLYTQFPHTSALLSDSRCDKTENHAEYSSPLVSLKEITEQL